MFSVINNVNKVSVFKLATVTRSKWIHACYRSIWNTWTQHHNKEWIHEMDREDFMCVIPCTDLYEVLQGNYMLK